MSEPVGGKLPLTTGQLAARLLRRTRMRQWHVNALHSDLAAGKQTSPMEKQTEISMGRVKVMLPMWATAKARELQSVSELAAAE